MLFINHQLDTIKLKQLKYKKQLRIKDKFLI